ncbi:MAG TPA: hypothetical protein VFB21_01595, partial [Chthonomonadaceae bacterium]|nr:hypothetical protein [Chthonomonadaceae bacterium]
FSTHLTTAMALTFSKQGTLLALVGGRTNAILEFTAGGRKVRRFAELIPRCQALAADAHGRVYAIGGTPRRRQLRMYDALGNVLHQLDLDMQSTYSCMTVDPTGRIYLANYVKGCIEGFTISGQRFSAFGQKTFSSPARMAFSPQGHLYVTEKDSPLVDVFAPPHDAPVFSFPLPANFEVLALAFHPNGNLYLSGVPTSD